MFWRCPACFSVFLVKHDSLGASAAMKGVEARSKYSSTRTCVSIFFHGMAIVVHLIERINGASPKRWLSGLVRGHDKSIQNIWEYLAIDGFQFPGGINERFSSGIRLILRVTSMRVSCRFCFMPRYDPQSTKPNVFGDEENHCGNQSFIRDEWKNEELFLSASVGNTGVWKWLGRQVETSVRLGDVKLLPILQDAYTPPEI